MSVPVNIALADRLPASTLLRARRAWVAGKSVGVVRAILGCRNDHMAYMVMRRCQFPKRPREVSRRLMGHRRSQHAQNLEDTVQPVVPAIVATRRCGRCRGYTDRASCHRCGAG